MKKPIKDIFAPISLGELIDKMTILRIKTKKLKGTAGKNVEVELKILENILEKQQIKIDPIDFRRLMEINQELWEIEDNLRENERRGIFDQEFINLARAVYKTNDQRAAIKREINIMHGSKLIEEKSYESY